MRAAPLCGVLMMMCVVAGAQTNSAGTAAALARSQKVSKDGCPAPVPPSTSDSTAGSTDWVELQRTECAGGCPAYTVRVYGDGSISWHGDSRVATTGAATASVDGTAAKALIQDVAQRGFWGLCQRYDLAGHQRDLETIHTTLSLAGHVKRVTDSGESAPSWLREMDAEIDSVSNTHLWRHGGPESETFGDQRLAVDALMPKVGVTQLMKAAALPDTGELIKTLPLLAPVNQGDSSGWTALMYAAQAGSVDGMNLLLKAGADPNARTNEGETALLAAVTAPNQAEAKFRLLQAAGVDLNAQDHRGVTPLMLACGYFYRPRLVATLLILGADPSKRDADGKTAMDYLDAAEALAGQDALYGQVRELLMKK